MELVKLAKQLDPDVALAPVQPMHAVIGAVVAPRRLAIALVGGFSLIAVVLALGGLYGVMAASVAERTHEMGLRAALGATPAGLVRMVMLRGLVLTGVGVAIGVAVFVTARGLVSRFVFGVSAADPVTLVAVSGMLVGVSVVACLLPGVRAARVDPIEVLKG
jgi:ABC-type antimicrobial peptide transport system permease subunit